jgi:hypothetical protein
MKLTELNPRWTGTRAIITGITFDCPHCRTQRLGVLFQNAIDPDKWLEKGVTRHHATCEWQRSGDSFDTLTLSPSIDTTEHRLDFADGHWHGFIRNGEVVD